MAGGKYFNPKKAELLSQVQSKTAELTTATKAKNFKKAAKLADEVEALQAQIDSSPGRGSTKTVTQEEAIKALKEKPKANEVVVIVKASGGILMKKQTVNPEVKYKRAIVDIESILPKGKERTTKQKSFALRQLRKLPIKLSESITTTNKHSTASPKMTFRQLPNSDLADYSHQRK